MSNASVTHFLDALNHPLRTEIEHLRSIILSAMDGLTENIKWNAPNYGYEGQDRITMKLYPPRQIQLIFHRGAKKQALPKERLIPIGANLLVWKENDRAIASFKTLPEVDQAREELAAIVKAWVMNTRPAS